MVGALAEANKQLEAVVVKNLRLEEHIKEMGYSYLKELNCLRD